MLYAVVSERQGDTMFQSLVGYLVVELEDDGSVVFVGELVIVNCLKGRHQLTGAFKVHSVLVGVLFFVVDTDGAAFFGEVTWFAPLEGFFYGAYVFYLCSCVEDELAQVFDLRTDVFRILFENFFDGGVGC